MNVVRRNCSVCGAFFIEEGEPTEPATCDACARYDAEADDPQAAAPFLPPSDDFTPPTPGVFDKPRRFTGRDSDDGSAFA